jgi:hypothetical protein
VANSLVSAPSGFGFLVDSFCNLMVNILHWDSISVASLEAKGCDSFPCTNPFHLSFGLVLLLMLWVISGFAPLGICAFISLSFEFLLGTLICFRSNLDRWSSNCKGIELTFDWESCVGKHSPWLKNFVSSFLLCFPCYLVLLSRLVLPDLVSADPSIQVLGLI